MPGLQPSSGPGYPSTRRRHRYRGGRLVPGGWDVCRQPIWYSLRRELPWRFKVPLPPPRSALARSLTSEGLPVGHAYAYSGDPSWVMMDVVAPGFTGVYHCELQLADGAIVTAGSVAVHNGTGEWARLRQGPGGPNAPSSARNLRPASLWPRQPSPDRAVTLPTLSGCWPSRLAGLVCASSSGLTRRGTAPWPAARALPRPPRR